MPNPSGAFTPALARLVRLLACLAFAIALVPGIAAAQTHHRSKRQTHHQSRSRRYHHHTGAHSSRRSHDGSHRRHHTSGNDPSSGNHPGNGSSSGGNSAPKLPVTTPKLPITAPKPPPPTPRTPPVTTPPSGGSGSTGGPAPGGGSTPPFEIETPLGAFSGGGRPFAVSSPWNVPIPTNSVLDTNSATIAGYLGSDGKAYADLYEYGNPVWEATAGTPQYNVTCTENWGTCPLSAAPIAIPSSAEASSGSDGSMVVIDWSTRTGYDFWRALKTSSGWTAAWGTAFSIDGTGTGDGATGAGMPLLAGMIRTYEIEQGHIDHALTFSTDNACQGVLRYPASKTDGNSSQGNCIPEGARVQLDPSINVDAIPGITPAERMIAHALQTYGAYADNNGGAKMAFSFENPAGKPNPYPAAGLASDYYDMPHIPWKQLRVLRTWNGS